MLRTCFALCFVFSLVLTSAFAEAQVSQGGIRGIVTDESAGVLIGVTVTASSPARIGDPAVAVTNNMGLYRFENLPLGVYTLTFTLPGFATLNRENIVVEVGRTVQLDIILPLAGAEETVTVTAASPVIDTVHSDYKTNFNQELLRNVPTTRNAYFDILTSVPGVKAGQGINVSNFSLYGSNIDQNSFQMDGVDVSSVSAGGPWDYPNYDIIQEVQVLGVGASAEFAGFQGGAINIVTKSGSNTLRGNASVFLIDDWMVGNNNPEEKFPMQTDYQFELTTTVSGPIVKDRLSVLGTYRRSDTRGVPVGVELTPDVPKVWANKWFLKLNGVISDKDNVDFSLNWYQFDAPTRPSRTRPVEATPEEIGHNPVPAVRWMHVFNPSTLLEVKGGGIFIRDTWGPTSGDTTTPGRYDVATGLQSVNFPYDWRTHQSKTQVAAALTHYADDFIKGSHDFKFGAQFLRSLDKTANAYNSGVRYYDYNTAPYYATYRAPAAYGANVDGDAVFVNDAWTMTDRVTLNLGVRFDLMRASIPELEASGVTFPGEDTLIDFKHWSPRLGMTVMLDEAGKTVAKASYGRFYGKIAANWLKNQSEGNTTYFSRFFNPATGRYDIPYWTFYPTLNLVTDPNLENQYTDAFFGGMEREIYPDVRLDLSFIYKKEENFVRVKDLGGEYQEIPFEDTFKGQTQILTVFNRVSPSAQSRYTTTNRDDFEQSYKSFVIQANKRWSNKWTLNGSYQWQRGFGTASGAIPLGDSQSFTNMGKSGFGADPNDMTNAYGRLPSDSTHTMKVAAAFELPYSIVTGIRYTFEDGRPFGRVVRVTGLRQGGRDVIAEKRGSYKLESAHDLSVRIDKDFNLGGRKLLRFSMDIFNVLNKSNAINLRNNSTQAGEEFLQSLEVPGPRRAMFGIRFDF